MSTVGEFLSRLRFKGIKLWTEGPDLCFDAPKGVLTPALKAELKARKADILVFFRQAGNAADTSLAPIPRAPRGGPLPLSFPQQRLWFLNQLEETSAAYNEPSALRLEGRLCILALEGCIAEIVRRHEILRTTFPMFGDRPVQTIQPAGAPALKTVDLRALDESRRSAAARELAKREARGNFVLARDHLLRVCLLRLGADRHVLLLTMHHIVCDGWSLGILVRELGAIYGALIQNRPSPLAELPIQYGDFAYWQRQQLNEAVLGQQLQYWKSRLRDAPSLLELPLDKPRQPAQTFDGATHEFFLSRRLAGQLKTLCLEQNATLFMCLQAALAVLLARYSGQYDFVLGAAIANRNRKDIEPLIGVFVNTLAIRLDLGGNPSFAGFLQRVVECDTEAFSHQDVPYEQVVEAIQPQRNMSYPPVFQVMFVLQNAPIGEIDVPGLVFSTMEETEFVSSKFDLTLYTSETRDGLYGILEYNVDLFHKATVERMAGHYRTLLEAVAERVRLPLARLPILTGSEREQLLTVWNDTEEKGPDAACIHHLFEARAQCLPDAVAVQVPGDSEQSERPPSLHLDYRQLDARSDRWARRLRAMGVGTDAMVGILVERSIDMVVGILGIVKAGAAYLPMDPSYPPERLAYIVENASVPVLLTQSRLASRIPELSAEVAYLDEALPPAVARRVPRLDGCASRASLSYAIYTSGSTGKPKGVLNTHGGLINLVFWHRRDYRVTAADRATLLAKIGFDASVWELWPYITAGACIVVGRSEILGTPAVLRDWLLASAVTIGFLPIPLAESVLHIGWPRHTALRIMLTGSDRLRKFPPAGLPFKLINNYGPSETAVIGTWFEVPPEGSKDALPSIGRPIANTRIYILDSAFRVVPIGVHGEMFIAGPSPGRGYHGRTRLTAEKFIPDPFSVEPGARLYRTGDLVRYLPGGNIDFLDRIDGQIKIRALRIEPGEVEAALVQHPAVTEAVVIAREDRPGERRLVAYVVPADPSKASGSEVPDKGELCRFLLDKIPDYMVPTVFVSLPRLPLTPNGKVDRRGLPVPEERAVEESFVEPGNEIERKLCGIWCEVLHREKVSVHANFFEMGGHSLLAAQLISRIREAFSLEIPLKHLFVSQTVASLGERVAAALAVQGDSETTAPPPLVPGTRPSRIPLSFAQQRLWFLERLGGLGAAYHLPFALRLHGPLGIADLENGAGHVVRRHESLRTTFHMEGEEPVQRIHETRRVRVATADLSGLDDARRHRAFQALTMAEAVRPFDLSAGPLFRMALLRLGARDHVLLLNMHHIVSDGWSVGVLVGELAALYRQSMAVSGTGREGVRAFSLPELPLQYADYAIWQRQWLRGEIREQQLGFWRTHLEGAPAFLELPTDRPRPHRQTHRGAAIFRRVPEKTTQSLVSLSRSAGATLFMTLTAGFQALLHRYSGQDDVVLGTVVANRNRKEIEPLIGFFVNTLALRGDFSGRPDFNAVLSRTRKTVLDGFAHQDVPFEQVVEALQPRRDVGRSPLFQVLFTMENTPGGALDLPGLRLGALEGEAVTAKFDLSLSISETDGGLLASFIYNADLFDRTTIARLAGHYANLLAAVGNDPGLDVTRCRLLHGPDRQALLREWNDTRVWDERQERPLLHGPVEQRAAAVPDAVSVVDDDAGAPRHLSYRKLDREANRLAHRLKALGVAPETMVGIRAERSTEMVVGLLGILKAGGAYVPIDSSYPQDRQRFMVADAGIAVLVAQDCRDNRFLRVNRQVSLPLKEKGPAEDSLAPVSRKGPDSRHGAYLIYTSGSTGMPKGVLLPHIAICNRLAWIEREAGLAPDDRLLQKTPYSFDVSVWEFFWPLRGGAVLVMARPGLHGEPAYLAGAIARTGITAIHFVPSMLHLFLEGGAMAACGSLRRVMCSGEALSPELRQRFFEALKACRNGGNRSGTVSALPLFNFYGPTETAVEVVAWRCRPGEDHAPVPIGRPIANTSAYISDRYPEPVPMGVPGELLIGGLNLARGYHNRPERTAASFVPDPFGSLPGDRLYRTGDLVRNLGRGEIEFLGRIDRQVKLRGFRIELGEIESQLAGHVGVDRAVVVVREDRYLAAYVRAKPECPIAQRELEQELRERLKRALPEFMHPSAYQWVDAFPLTPSGKVDRKALPDPLQDRTDFEAPTNRTETALCRIWAGLLQRDRVGISDHFFELGGHSLLVTRLVSRVRETFGVTLPLQDVFDQPTVAGQSERIRRLQTGLADASTENLPSLEPVDRNRPLPLSYAQQRLWFLDQLERREGLGADAAYNLPAALRLSGRLDAVGLGRGFSLILQRHESLRTRFETVDGEPVQKIEPWLPPQLPVVDLTALSSKTQLRERTRLTRAEAAQPFRLARGPLLRTHLLRLEPEEHLLLATMHHIVSDAWSTGILIGELAAAYRAWTADPPTEPELPPLPVQYADFADWQRRWLAAGELERQLDYWKWQLKDLPVLDLPTDRPRPPQQSYRGTHCSFHIEPALVKRLNRLAQKLDTTLFMLGQGVLAALLARYGGQRDIAVGTPVANRNRIELEKLIGFFVNTLVLRNDCSGNPDFRKFMARVRETALAAYSHGEVPFERVVEALQPERDLSRTPLFQAMFVFQTQDGESAPLPGLSLSPEPVLSESAKFDMTVVWVQSGENLTGSWEFNSDLFDETTVRRMIGHFRNLLRSVADEPQRRFSDWRLLTEAEQAQLLFDWNDTGSGRPSEPCVHRGFERQAMRSPDSVALVHCVEGQTAGGASGATYLSYREVNRGAEILATRLRSLGVGPQIPVGIAVRRSPEMAIGLLAVLKAGGAYLPLDPEYPAERLRFMLEDAGATIVLTGPDATTPFSGTAAKAVTLDAGPVLASGGLSPMPGTDVPDNALVYVIYTSGSTGRPKGAGVYHRGFANLVHWFVTAFGLTASDRVLLISSLSFDLTQKNLFAPITLGGALFLGDAGPYDPKSIVKKVSENRITWLNCTPSAFYPLLEDGGGGDAMDSLRHVFLGGEPISVPRLMGLLEGNLCRARVVNQYGPTECSDVCAYFTIDRPARFPSRPVPVGRPNHGSRLYLLDRETNLVPPGVGGELCVAGAGLGAGYLGDAALTAKKFLPNPFPGEDGYAEPGARLYRTGDRARFQDEGSIEFLGRFDHQVKYRGFRIELGEIESVLAQHSAITAAAVVVRRDRNGTELLAANLIAKDGTAFPEEPELRAYCRKGLPEFMVPNLFLRLERFPLTPSGKVDRSELAVQPHADKTAAEGGRPKTAAEAILAEIWSEVLGVPEPDTRTSFFELGGHSLLAVRVVSRIRERLGVDLAVRHLFSAPTIAMLAGRLERVLGETTGFASPRVRPVSRDGDLPLSFAQQRLWFLDRLDRSHSAYHIPAALRLKGELDVAAMSRAVAAVVSRHEVFRTVFEERDGQPWVRPGLSRPVIPLLIDFSGLANVTAETLAKDLAHTEPGLLFDLRRGPLWRVGLVRISAVEHLLLNTLHHIIADGGSMDVLVGELADHYRCYSLGSEAVPVPLPALQYIDFAAWQRRFLDGAQQERQIAYWRNRLAGAPALLELPTDKARPPLQTFRGDTLRFDIDAAVAGRLKDLARQGGATPFMCLQTAFALLLARYSGQAEVVVGTPVANRTHREFEPLIGLFVNTLPMRHDFSGKPGFETCLAHTRDHTLDALVHADLPFEKLVEVLQPERALDHSPVFQVSFVYVEGSRQELALPGLQTETLGSSGTTAKFELSLGMTETGSGLGAELEYNIDLFEADSIQRMIGAFTTLLGQISLRPGCPVGELALLDDAAREEVLSDWNRTGATWPGCGWVHDLFQAQARRSPEAIALQAETGPNSEVSNVGRVFRYRDYRSLNRFAALLAGKLREHGVVSEALVGIFAERSPEMAAAMLGVLMVGAAYVPIDPDHPGERVSEILGQAGISTVLAAGELCQRLRVLPLPTSVRILDMNERLSRSDAPGLDSFRNRLEGGQLAYVLFTSGSTGKPKGVMISHDALRNHMLWMAGAYPFEADDRVFQKTPYGFDASVWEFYAPLLAGAALVLARPGGHREPGYLAKAVRDYRITVLQIVPSLLRALLDEPAFTDGSGLRRLFCGGEALDEPLLNLVSARLALPPINLYGPTETCIQSVAGVCLPDQWPVRIGRPIANVAAFVLGPHLEPVPVGVAGELFIGGICLAPGYLAEPGLSAPVFIPNPFSDRMAVPGPGTRLYRTGDRARILADGALVYRGRLDRQVKLRGFRIELGEIEARLSAHPALSAAAVIVREDIPGRQALTAYVETAGPEIVSGQTLRAFLSESLPGYMIPSAFVSLSELPRSTSGKIDRRSLPRPNRDSFPQSGTAPRNAIETELAGIWEELLQTRSISVHANFFEMGGHSLLATRVLSRIRAVFGVALPLRVMFETPTVAILARKIQAALESEKQVDAVPLEAVPRQGDLPLSFSQQRLWFLEQWTRSEGGVPSAAYNLPLALRLTGGLDKHALERALNALVRRHESLRTKFEDREGEPVQVFRAATDFQLPVVDLRGLSQIPGQNAARRLRENEAVRSFDLSRGPLFRVFLLQLESDRHLLLTTMHHMISDAWSMGVVAGELSAFYASFAGSGRGEMGSPLPDLPLQYADFAVWQQRRLNRGELDSQRRYWQRRLAGSPDLLALPTDRPRPPYQTYRGARLPFLLDESVTQGLRRVSGEAGATLFMSLLAGFMSLLRCYSGQDDVVVGTPVANRNRPELEGLIGFLVNTLALRCDLSGKPATAELLARVRETALAAYARQDLPFEQVVEAVDPKRNTGHNPIFQVMLVLQNAPMGPAAFPGLHMAGDEAETVTAKFDLTLVLTESDGVLRGTANYNTDLFDGATVQRLLRHYHKGLRCLWEQSRAPLSLHAMMEESERQQVLLEWNDTHGSLPGQGLLHGFFEAQVSQRPDATALVFEGDHRSYEVLNRDANALAATLAGEGVAPETLVGVFMARSLEMVTALLGVLKAGGAYLPLEPDTPEERLAWILEDAAVPLAIVGGNLAPSLPAKPPRLIGVFGSAPSGPQPAVPRARVEPQHPAYMIYTSGSTGLPKGVTVCHRPIFNRIGWMQQTFGLKPDDRILQKTPFGFDVSLWELFWPHAAGAATVVAEPDGHRDPLYLARIIDETRVTTIHFVPSMLGAFLNAVVSFSGTGLRRVFCGGEALSPQLQERLFRRVPARLCNFYGPTEAAIGVTCWKCVPGDERETLPIGRPIANARIRVLDPDGLPLPVGVPGELHIGGIPLARGYHRRPALTATRFVPDAFGGEPGARLYRSGDSVRFEPGGLLAFIGRLDHQVKLRGFRVELGEIESVLASHPRVAESAVVLCGEAERSSLTAFFRWRGGDGSEAPDETEAARTENLREYLKRKLPEYMVPSRLVPLARFPVTASGKMDRAALGRAALGRAALGRAALGRAALGRAALEGTAHGSGRESRALAGVPPRTGTEQVLATIWSAVLQVGGIGAHDHFFELGGHSLLATQVVSRIRDLFGVELSLRTLFAAPTLAALGTAIDSARSERSGSLPRAIRKAPRNQRLPLSFGQRRMWFLEQLSASGPGGSAYLIFAAFRLTGPLDVAILNRAMDTLVRRHEVLRTCFPAVKGRPYQEISPTVAVELPCIEIDGPYRRVLNGLISREAGRGFDLGTPPLFRVRLFRLAPRDRVPEHHREHGREHVREHVLCMNLHHIVADGWSLGVFARELSECYRSVLAGRDPDLPELSIQYADFAQWQRRRFEDRDMRAQLAYWRQRLAGAPALLTLATDKPRPSVRTSNGALARFEIDAPLYRSFQSLCTQQGATLFMGLEAVFSLLLSRYSGQRDVSVGTPVANRNRSEIEPLIGFFVNTLVLRHDLSGDPSFESLIEAVRSTALDAYAHQDIPFEALVEAIQPERSLSHTPLFQAMLILQNLGTSPLDLPGLAATVLEGSGSDAKFDLSLSMTPTEASLLGTFEYNTDLFHGSTIRRMAAQLKHLIAGVTGDPRRRLSHYALMDEAARQLILREWNDTAEVGEGVGALHGFAEIQAVRRPDGTALVFGDRHITYRAMNRDADHLAATLAGAGVGPETLVGIFAERSTEMVVALLGVLKAGGAYLPIEPETPEERSSWILEDSAVAVLVAQGSLQPCPPPCVSKVIALSGRVPPGPTASERPAAMPDHPAYLIYTSGSTGRPKGTAVSHSAICNRLRWGQRRYPLLPEDRLLQKTPFGFDVSLWEFFWPQVAGAVLIVAKPGGHRDPVYLGGLIDRQRVTNLHFVPSMLHVFLDAVPGFTGTGLRRVFCSGEALTPGLLDRFFERMSVPLHNLYGPTEAAVEVTFWECRPRSGSDTVPIGRPIANTRMYVLDGDGRPTPVGIPGELHIGGLALARGYRRLSGLTAERFVPNPFGPESGGRLYRTGDLARFRAKGFLEFLGRRDHQIKLRGFRIELGEIESVLCRHPAIAAAAVVVWEREPAEKRLVAYVQATPEAQGSGKIGSPEEWTASFRAYLKQRLPAHMVPADFVVFTKLPMTASGKLDRRALPGPAPTETGKAGPEPETPTEVLVARHWAEILGLKSVSRDDHFFELGGHSLHAAQAAARLGEAFGVSLPVRTFFELPTVSGLSAQIESLARTGTGTAWPAPVPRKREGFARLSLWQQRVWNIDRETGVGQIYNLSRNTYLHGPIDLGSLERAFCALAERHEILRTLFPIHEGGAVQAVQPELPPCVKVVDLGGLTEMSRPEAVRVLAEREVLRRFDLISEFSLRATVLRLDRSHHALLAVMHHIVTDGWSFGIVSRELTELYRAHCRGEAHDLKPPQLQFGDVADWQRALVEKGYMDGQRAYWRSKLAGIPKRTELPVDRPHPEAQEFGGDALTFDLDRALTHALKRHCRQAGTTLFTALHAAFAVALGSYSSQKDIVVGTPFANRNRREVEEVPGYFVNVLALRCDLSGNPCWTDLLGRHRKTVLEAYANQDVPLPVVIGDLGIEPNPGFSPVFQVLFNLFNLQNVPEGEWVLPGLSQQPVEKRVRLAKYELTLNVHEWEQGLRGTLLYRTGLFDRTTIRALARRYRDLLHWALKDPRRPLSAMMRLTAESGLDECMAGEAAVAFKTQTPPT